MGAISAGEQNSGNASKLVILLPIQTLLLKMLESKRQKEADHIITVCSILSFFCDRAAERSPLCRPVSNYRHDLYFPTSQIAARIHSGWRRLMGLPPLRGSLRAARRQKYHYVWRESWRQPAIAAWKSWTRSLPCLAVFYGSSPQVVLAQSFPSLVPPGTYVYADIYFSRCCRALSAPLRAKSRRILSMISRSTPLSVLASRSSKVCCAKDKYLFLNRYPSTR